MAQGLLGHKRTRPEFPALLFRPVLGGLLAYPKLAHEVASPPGGGRPS